MAAPAFMYTVPFEYSDPAVFFPTRTLPSIGDIKPHQLVSDGGFRFRKGYNGQGGGWQFFFRTILIPKRCGGIEFWK